MLTPSSSLPRRFSRVVWSLCETSRAASSANNNSLHEHAAGMSFIYKRNRRGPNTLPCGTPHGINWGSDRDWLTSILWILSERYVENQLTADLDIPMALSLLSSMAWLTVSKAFWRSNRTSPHSFPESISFLILSVVWIYTWWGWPDYIFSIQAFTLPTVDI